MGGIIIKIVLTSPASSFVHCALAPWCLKDGVERYAQNKFQIKVVDMSVNEPVETAAQKIIAERPDCIGLGCYIWNIIFIQNLLKIIKNNLPDLKIVIGGPEVSEDPQNAFSKLPEAEFLIRGEGEILFARLMDSLFTKQYASGIEGVCSRENPYCESFSSEAFPGFPYCDEYFKQLNGRISYIETSRGCPFSCSFCLSGKKTRVKYLPLQQSKEAILQLASSSSQTIKFVDRTFNANVKRAKEIISFIVEKRNEGLIPAGKCFHFEVAADLIDDETIDLFNEAPAGLFQIEAGIQSLNNHTLNAVSRSASVERICLALKEIIKSNRVHVHVDLIAGLPYENLQSFICGFNHVFKMHPHALQLGFLKVLYGSRIKSQAEEYGIIYSKKPPYQVTQTKWLSVKDLDILRQAEHALELLYNRQRFVNTVIYITQNLCEPFEFFYEAGGVISSAELRKGKPLSLDELTEAVFYFLTDKFSHNAHEIKNLMLIDRLSFVATSNIPVYLKTYCSQLNELKRKINKLYPKHNKIHRAYAVMQQDKELYLLWADYTNRHPVTKSYFVNRILIKKILNS